MRDGIDSFEEAIAVDVVPCFYAQHPLGKFGHSWAVTTIDGRPRCAGCVEWEQGRR